MVEDSGSPIYNLKAFQQSITRELIDLKDRVRNIIGDSGWGPEGSYKERLLIQTLKKYLPNSINVSSGYIYNYKNPNKKLKHVDIIIYSDDLPVIFQDTGIVIVTPEVVKAIIE